MQEFGHRVTTPEPPILPPPTTTASATSSGFTAASSGGLHKKEQDTNKVNKRCLKQRNREPVAPKSLCRDLGDERNKAAEGGAERMDEEPAAPQEPELMTEEQKVESDMAYTSGHADGNAFWDRLRLKDRNGCESAARAAENKAMKSAFDHLAHRVEKLERAEAPPVAEPIQPAPRRADGWSQNSIIIGTGTTCRRSPTSRA